jgi:large subunit ribosomal protein L11
MAKVKQVKGKAAFQVTGGQATPAPPVGTSLGKFGINLGQFVSQFNERTREFMAKSPPASALLKMAAGCAKGAGVPNKDKVGKVTKAQILEIVKKKEDVLNCMDPVRAGRMIEGTARSMGIVVEG